MTEGTKSGGWGLPILRGILPIKAGQTPAEAIAGPTLATLAIPEVMGYTNRASSKFGGRHTRGSRSLRSPMGARPGDR